MPRCELASYSNKYTCVGWAKAQWPMDTKSEWLGLFYFCTRCSPHLFFFRSLSLPQAASDSRRRPAAAAGEGEPARTPGIVACISPSRSIDSLIYPSLHTRYTPSPWPAIGFVDSHVRVLRIRRKSERFLCVILYSVQILFCAIG
jgi:hypothetical protein